MRKRLFAVMIHLAALLAARLALAETEAAGTVPEETVQAAAETARVSGIQSNWIMIAVLVGFLIAMLVTAAWKAQLRSVHAKWEAGNYVRRDSLNLRSRNERFLYRTVQKVPIPKQENQNGHGGMGGAGGMGFGGHSGGFGGQSGSGGLHINLGGPQSGSQGHGGFTLGGHSNTGHSGSGLNYGGHIEPGGRPQSGGPLHKGPGRQ